VEGGKIDVKSAPVNSYGESKKGVKKVDYSPEKEKGRASK